MTSKKFCLNVDYILDTILGKLPLRNKFTAQLVCRRWKHRSIVLLKQHKSVALSSRRPKRDLIEDYHCNQHPMNEENAITFDLHDMESWRRVLFFLPGIEFIFVDNIPNPDFKIRYFAYRELLKYVVEMYGSRLQCLWINFHGYQGVDFLKTDCFPQLRHLHFLQTSDTNLVRIIKSCPRLEYLKCCTYITEWNLLPKGFKKIERDSSSYDKHLKGMINLVTGKAAETMEEILGMELPSGVFRDNFSLPRLNTLEVWIREDTNGCLNNLARIVRFSPVLKKLLIEIESEDDIDASSWVTVIEKCSEITDLTVHLSTNSRPLKKVSVWQDAFAESVSLNMKKLKTLKLDFALSSIDLIKLSTLPELQFFHHKISIDQQNDLDDLFF